MTARTTTSLIGGAPLVSGDAGSRPRRPGRRWPRRRGAPRGDGDAGRRDEHEAADVLAAGEHRELDAVGRQLEAAAAVVATPVAHRGRRLRWHRCGRCAGSRASSWAGRASKRHSRSASSSRSSSWAAAMTSAASARSPPPRRRGGCGGSRTAPSPRGGGPSGRPRRSCRRARRRRSSSTVVSTSSRESIDSDRYGWVWKKSNETTAASAVTIPAARPPSAATATTTIISTSAALVVSKNERTVAIERADADRRRDADDDADRQTVVSIVGTLSRFHRRPRKHPGPVVTTSLDASLARYGRSSRSDDDADRTAILGRQGIGRT